jgi:hypothetical protein
MSEDQDRTFEDLGISNRDWSQLDLYTLRKFCEVLTWFAKQESVEWAMWQVIATKTLPGVEQELERKEQLDMIDVIGGIALDWADVFGKDWGDDDVEILSQKIRLTLSNYEPEEKSNE